MSYIEMKSSILTKQEKTMVEYLLVVTLNFGNGTVNKVVETTSKKECLAHKQHIIKEGLILISEGESAKCYKVKLIKE